MLRTRSFYVTRARASFEGYRMLPKTGVDKRVLNRFEQLIGCVRYSSRLSPCACFSR